MFANKHSLFDSLGPFEPQPTLAIAVSGGADSLALALLAHDWANERNGRIIALTVDHGLRVESASEAETVHQWCTARGIEHRILRILEAGFRIQGNGIQAQARTARYRLLTDWCRAHHIVHLLTAHHRDDQAETLLFRLARGSGMDGLACMPSISMTGGVRLLRPLLPVAKTSLEAYLVQRNQRWLEDPSNQSPRYTRNRIRQCLQCQPEYIIARTAAAAQHFAAIRAHLEQRAALLMPTCLSLFPEGYGLLHKSAFASLPQEYGKRLLAAAIVTLTGAEHPPRTHALERLHADVTAHADAPRSLGGILFIPKAEHWLLCREPSAAAAPILIENQKNAQWDHRFEAYWEGYDCGQRFELRALGQEGKGYLATLGMALPRLPALVLHSLPAFWRLEELVAVPHICYTNQRYRHLAFHARFRPAKPLAGSAFSGMNSQVYLPDYKEIA